MTNCYFRLNIHDDCDFGLCEFSELSNISIKELDNKDKLNKKLRNNIKSMDIQISNIERTKKSMVIHINVNPIYNISPETLPISSFEIVSNDDPTLETISLTLFVAGCPRRCLNCQNPELQEVNSKNHKLLTLDQVKEIINDKLCLIKSVTFCGGDFLPLYEIQLIELVKFCKSINLKTILYTGELFENINDYLKKDINIIVDGPYLHNKKTNRFPASSNQRCWIDGQLINCDDLEINRN